MNRYAGIYKAMDAYGLWKARLRTAVATGRSDMTSEQAAVVDACEFGQWLMGLPPSDRDERYFARVDELHRQFHAHAAEVVRLVEAGETARAGKALESGAPFEVAGRELTRTLIEWSKAA